MEKVKSLNLILCCLCLVVQSYLTLCNPMDRNLPGSSVRGGSLGKNTGMGCHALLQGTFSTQGSNPGLQNCRQTLRSESAGKPKSTGEGSLSLLQGIFPPQESNQGLLHCRWILYQLSYQGSPNSTMVSDNSVTAYIAIFIYQIIKSRKSILNLLISLALNKGNTVEVLNKVNKLMFCFPTKLNKKWK